MKAWFFTYFPPLLIGLCVFVAYLRARRRDRQAPSVVRPSDAGVEQPAHVMIRRGKSYADRLRAYRIRIDGIVAASVGAGGSVSIPVAPGRHSLVLRIDWCGSEEIVFDAQPDEHLTFECGSSVAGWRILLLFYYAVFRTSGYLWLRRGT
jgi:hypothetical protein